MDISNLTCPVCYNLFTKPKYLPCYHTYCEQCLEKIQMMQEQTNIITCPECRKEAAVPPGGVKDLNDNFFIDSLVNEFIQKHAVQGKCKDCSRKHPVVAYCPDCKIVLCQYCVESHKCISHGKKYVNIQPEIMCKEHNLELLLYCETCNMPMCTYCSGKYHIDHCYATVKDLAVEYKQELKKETAVVEEMTRGMADARSNIEEMREKIRQQGDEVKNKIDRHYDEVIQKIMEQKQQLKRQVQDTVSQKQKAITAQLDELERAQIQALKMRILNEGVEMKSDQEVVFIKKQVIHHMKDISNKCNKVCLPPIQQATMEFVPSKDTLPQLGLLGSAAEPDPHNCEVVDPPKYSIKGEKTDITVITKDENGGRCSGGSAVNVKLIGVGDTVQVRDNNDGTYVASFVPQQVGKVKMSVLINEQQIKGSPYSIVVKDYTSLNKPSKVVNDNGNMGRPWGIAFSNKNGMWAVSDWSNHLVYIFDDKDRLVTMFGGYGTGDSQFHHPQGVVFDNDGCLFVVDSANHRVQKFNPETKYLLEFGSKESRYMELENPNGLAVHKGKVRIC